MPEISFSKLKKNYKQNLNLRYLLEYKHRVMSTFIDFSCSIQYFHSNANWIGQHWNVFCATFASIQFGAHKRFIIRSRKTTPRSNMYKYKLDDLYCYHEIDRWSHEPCSQEMDAFSSFIKCGIRERMNNAFETPQSRNNMLILGPITNRNEFNLIWIKASWWLKSSRSKSHH